MSHLDMDVNKSHIIEGTACGNGLAATSDLEAGELIVEIANPYIVVVEKASLHRVCSQCLLATEKLKRCARCKVVQYCSSTCQTKAWKSMHRLECSALARMPGIPPTVVRALMQILLTHTSGSVPDPRWRYLETNQEYLSRTGRYPDMILQAKAACKYAQFSPHNALELAMGILCRLSTNSFRATSAGNDLVGLCFEPVLSLANHSCSPNAVILFDGRKIMLRALDPIKKDNQIFISYVDGTQCRVNRQAELEQAYFFTCNCRKCARDESPYDSYLRSLIPYRNSKVDLFLDPQALRNFALSTIISAPTSDEKSMIHHLPQHLIDGIENILHSTQGTPDRDFRLGEITRALQSVRSFREIGFYALPPYPSILHELYLYYIDGKAFIIALSLLVFIHLNCYAYLYPQPNHPLNVERLFTMAKLCGALIPDHNDEEGVTSVGATSGGLTGTKLKELTSIVDWFSAARVLLILATDLIPLSHGKDTRFAREVVAMLVDIEEAQKTRPGLAGDALKRWAQDDDVGQSYAQQVFEGLRRLGGKDVAEGVMDMGLHLLAEDK